jgi:hypothetical protein
MNPMRRKYLLTSFMLVAALLILITGKVSSHIKFPPAGSCGDPTDSIYCTQLPQLSTCAQCSCHGSPTHAVTPQSLNLQIGTDSNSLSILDSNFKYVPGTTYYINFNVLLGGYVQGFQLTALNPNKTMGGSLTPANLSTEHIESNVIGSDTVYYISHLHAHNGVSSWIFQWTAPTTDSSVTFYYAFNSGDSADFWGGSGSGIPDSNIFVGTVTINHGFGAGIANNAINSLALQVYPNPVNGEFSMSFNMVKPGMASASLYSVDGRLCKQLFNEGVSGNSNRSYDISSLASGVYLVKLVAGGTTVTEKIVKE